MENVLAVNFADDANAYEALSKLKELDGQGQVEVAGAAVVARAENGTITVKDEVGDSGYTGTATGGIIGLVIGILGGPFGVLLGGSTSKTPTTPNRCWKRSRARRAPVTRRCSHRSPSRARRWSTRR
jgi:ElaB/YqjD/DUF883 family membrane-anchored ribosome-binding protein